ncbi:ABC transporter [Klebsiella pneumoniae]|nr:ABC transporter [Klebsiella pneumoniae]
MNHYAFSSFFKNCSELFKPREGANKQVISSQADSLIKISRIWADFFPANTSNQPI